MPSLCLLFIASGVTLRIENDTRIFNSRGVLKRETTQKIFSALPLHCYSKKAQRPNVDYRALRAKEIRPRKFYATRHTYISVALSHSVNIKWLAEQCGTSVEMIERNYGRHNSR